MLYANVNGEKVEASPKTKGSCLICDEAVVSKCGKVNVWHWAHQIGQGRDSWYEPETLWHKSWKLAFGKNNCEVATIKDGTRHIADIFTIDQIVIELQNSPITISTICERENFYGERMIWLINGQHFKENFITYRSQIDIDAEYDLYHNPLSDHYGKADFTRKGVLNFSWKQCRRSWRETQRYIFIDFGGDKLFRVIEGMGTNHGKGKYVVKKAFLEKYGGDIDRLATLVDNLR